MNLLLAVCALAIVPLLNLAAMAVASHAAARASGVRGGSLLFRHPPREAFEAASRGAFATTVAVGPVASYLCAVTLFFVALLVGGRYEYDGTVDVAPGGRAAAAGLRTGDRVVSVDGKPVARFEDVRAAIDGRAETRLRFEIDRAGERAFFDVVTNPEGRIQVAAGAPKRIDVSLGEAAASAALQPARVLVAVVATLLKPATVQIAGPEGIVRATSEAAGVSAATLFNAVGVMNAYYWPLSLIVAYGARPRRRERRAA